MVQPFADFEDYAEQEDAKRERSYEAKILKRVLEAIAPEEAKKLQREAGDEFGFRWFNDSVTHRIAMDATNVKVQIPSLLKTVGITKTALWSRFFDLRNEYGSPFALVFNIPGLGQWVIHDCSTLPQLPGYAYIVRMSARQDAELTIQPLEAFLTALQGM